MSDFAQAVLIFAVMVVLTLCGIVALWFVADLAMR